MDLKTKGVGVAVAAVGGAVFFAASSFATYRTLSYVSGQLDPKIAISEAACWDEASKIALRKAEKTLTTNPDKAYPMFFEIADQATSRGSFGNPAYHFVDRNRIVSRTLALMRQDASTKLAKWTSKTGSVSDYGSAADLYGQIDAREARYRILGYKERIAGDALALLRSEAEGAGDSNNISIYNNTLVYDMNNTSPIQIVVLSDPAKYVVVSNVGSLHSETNRAPHGKEARPAAHK
jgi:hypothetical protein